MRTNPCLVLSIAFIISAPQLFARQEEEPDVASSETWNLSLRSRVKSVELKRGIDLSGDQGIAGLSASLAHESGWNGSISATNGLVTGKRLSSSFGFGYDGSFTESFSWSLDFSHTEYQSDSLNALAALGNSLSIGLDYDLGAFAVAVDAERYFGSSPATYLSADLSTMLEVGEWNVIPSLTVSFVSQTVDLSRIANLKKKKQGLVLTTKKISGVSGVAFDAIVSYPLGSGFSISANPAITFTPQADLSTQSAIFSIAAGIRYSIDF